jgi:hypothetical protein
MKMSPLQFDPSGRYLFLNDESIHTTVVVAVDLTHKTLRIREVPFRGLPQLFPLALMGGWFTSLKINMSDLRIQTRLPPVETQRSISFPLTPHPSQALRRVLLQRLRIAAAPGSEIEWP